MQTLLGKVIVICLKVTALTFLVVVIYVSTWVGMFGQVNKIVAKILACMMSYIGAMFYLSVMSVTLAKYLSIYHGTFLHDLNEKQTLRYVKHFLGIAPLVLTIAEYIWLTDVETTQQYLVLRSATGSELSKYGIHYGYIVIGEIFATSASTVYLQFCIEVDHYRKQEHGGWMSRIVNRWIRNQSQDIDESSSVYKLSVTRVTAFIGIVLCGIISFSLSRESVDFSVLLLVFLVVLTNVCPAIFIACHPGMKVQGIRLVVDFFDALSFKIRT